MFLYRFLFETCLLIYIRFLINLSVYFIRSNVRWFRNLFYLLCNIWWVWLLKFFQYFFRCERIWFYWFLIINFFSNFSYILCLIIIFLFIKINHALSYILNIFLIKFKWRIIVILDFKRFLNFFICILNFALILNFWKTNFLFFLFYKLKILLHLWIFNLLIFSV